MLLGFCALLSRGFCVPETVLIICHPSLEKSSEYSWTKGHKMWHFVPRSGTLGVKLGTIEVLLRLGLDWAVNVWKVGKRVGQRVGRCTQCLLNFKPSFSSQHKAETCEGTCSGEIYPKHWWYLISWIYVYHYIYISFTIIYISIYPSPEILWRSVQCSNLAKMGVVGTARHNMHNHIWPTSLESMCCAAIGRDPLQYPSQVQHRPSSCNGSQISAASVWHLFASRCDFWPSLTLSTDLIQ